jgi:hypothetical protein
MDNVIDRLGRCHNGALTTSALMTAGWTRDAIDHAVDCGHLIPIRRGVMRVAGAPLTQDLSWTAAVLAAGPGVVLGKLSASDAYRFKYFPIPDLIHLLSAKDSRPRLPGVVGHRTISLPAYDVTRLRSIPITTPERTFIDVCGTIPESLLGTAGDELFRRKIMRLPKLVKSFEMIPQSGRRKRRPMYGFFEERVKGFDAGGSDSELDVMRLLRNVHGIILPRQQFHVVVDGIDFYVDYAWPEVLHGLEWEGWEHHGKRVSDFHKDKDRTRRLQRAGWTLWPVTKQTTANEILAIAADVTALHHRS